MNLSLKDTTAGIPPPAAVAAVPAAWGGAGGTLTPTAAAGGTGWEGGGEVVPAVGLSPGGVGCAAGGGTGEPPSAWRPVPWVGLGPGLGRGAGGVAAG